MQHGFIKVAAAVPQLSLADPTANARAVSALLSEAHELGVKVAVFPALTLTGVTCGDLFFQRTLLDAAQQALRQVAFATHDTDTLAFVGLPLAANGALYAVTAAVYDGQILGFVPQSAEGRWFADVADFDTVSFDGEAVPFGSDLRFTHLYCPELTVGADGTLECLFSDEAELVGHASRRRLRLSAESLQAHCAIVCANPAMGESGQDAVYSGHSLIAENGRILEESQWKTGLFVTEIDVQALDHERRTVGFRPAPAREVFFGAPLTETVLTRSVSPAPFLPETGAAERSREILHIQAEGLARRIRHTGTKCLVLGVSGGLDSTLALLVCAEALKLTGRPASDLLAVTLPCFGTTARTRSNAEVMSEHLGAEFLTIDIKAAVLQHFSDIGHDPAVTDVTYENAQARERTQVLMDLAGERGGMVIGTGDLSELALGWATYNGDHMSMYSVNASLPKTLIRHVVATYAADCGDAALSACLYDVIDTPVSPELLPPAEGEIAQKTEDLVGPYELHDFFIYHTLRMGFTPTKIFRLARIAFAGQYADKIILKWLEIFCRRFFAQQFKRSCQPDGAAVGSISLSPRGGWLMPSDAVSGAWMQEVEELKHHYG